jgi:glycosyltransferase involved in cell wall biosynthesis
MTKPNDKNNKDLHARRPERHGQPAIEQHQSSGLEYDMIVFSHLRWQSVFQRPQHIISRLAVSLKILFVEEPVPFDEGQELTANMFPVNPNLLVMQPRVKRISDTGKVIRKYIPQKTISYGWFYSAAFSPLLNEMDFSKVIYDTMDDLTLFSSADPLLPEHEKLLLSRSHIVFTGGKSLFEAKLKLHANVYNFPSSVEHVHFRKALNGIAVPEDIANLKGPVVGFYGVINERIDLALIDEVSSLNPGTSLVMIGPVEGLADKDLPKRENIHYLGMRPYECLPNYLKGFDIAMMPFALNDATKFISPTKTLEYMAAGKPIISTAIPDLVRDYSNHITIVGNAREFCEAGNAIYEQVQKEKYNTEKYNDILHSTSWDTTVRRMEKLIQHTQSRL